MNVTIMRGISGSGKSSYIKKFFPDAKVFSTDNYFMENGIYKFDAKLLAINHNRCLINYLQAIQSHTPSIVVDNTNINAFEIAPYYRLAESLGYTPKIIWLICQWEIASKRNIHNVPPETVRRMSLSFEPLPLWWNIEVVYPSDHTAK